MLDHFEWKPLDDDETRKLAAFYLFNGDPAPLSEVALEGLVAELSFYKTLRLLWIKLLLPGQERLEHFFALDGADKGWPLDGKSSVIHSLNAVDPPHISEDTGKDYLRFFCFAVQGEEGAFELFEKANEPEDGAFVGEEAEIAALAEPIDEQGRGENGEFLYEALVHYGRSLHRSRFSVPSDGRILMLDDSSLYAEVPPGPFAEVPVLRPAKAIAALVWQTISKAVPATGTRRVMVEVLLERALGGRADSRLLAQFNAKRPGNAPVENFAHMLLTAAPVVAIEGSMPFVEETVGDIVKDTLGSSHRVRFFAASPDAHDGGKLQLSVPDSGPAVGLLPLHAYTSVADVERVAHQISARNLSCLIGCERAADLPTSLGEVVDVTVRLPRLDPSLFETLFSRSLGLKPPADWASGDTHWVTHVHHSDFQQPGGLGLDPEEALSFIRERAENRLRNVEPVKGLGLRDLHGLGEARTFAEDLISDIQAAMAGRLDWMHVDRGVLLVGAPGTGKTTLARAIAKDCGIRFVNASAATWQTAGHLGDHLRAIRADFAKARRYAPAILFIDEIDSLGSRETFSGANAQYHVEVVNALLQQIQGMDPEAPVIVIGATNFQDRVDPALKRAGRMDRVIHIPRPNAKALAQIYDHYLTEYVGEDVAHTIDAESLGRLSVGATGADIELYVRGAMRRARREDRLVGKGDLVDEISRKPRDPDVALRLSPKEVHRVAVHEAGHALAACLASSRGADLAFISIVPRSDGTLGFVARFQSDRAFLTRAEYLEHLEIILAGRAAEMLTFGQDGVSGGAGGSSESSDLAVATRMALELVTRHGLGPEGSLLWTADPDDDDRLEADRLLTEAYERVWRKLDDRCDCLAAIMKALMDRQELTGEEVRELVERGGP